MPDNITNLFTEIQNLIDNGDSLMHAISVVCNKNNLNPQQIYNNYFKDKKPQSNNIEPTGNINIGSVVFLNKDSGQNHYEVINISNKDAIILRNMDDNSELTASESEITPVITENEMTNLKEAQYNISIDGLTTEDADTLSQMLSLASQAENSSIVDEPVQADMAIEPMNTSNDIYDIEPMPSMDVEDDIQFDEELPMDTDLDTYDSSMNDIGNEELPMDNMPNEDMSMDDMMDDGMFESFGDEHGIADDEENYDEEENDLDEQEYEEYTVILNNDESENFEDYDEALEYYENNKNNVEQFYKKTWVYRNGDWEEENVEVLDEDVLLSKDQKDATVVASEKINDIDDYKSKKQLNDSLEEQIREMLDIAGIDNLEEAEENIPGDEIDIDESINSDISQQEEYAEELVEEENDLDEQIKESLKLAGIQLDEENEPEIVNQDTLYANEENSLINDESIESKPTYHDVDTTPFGKDASEGIKKPMTMESTVKFDKIKSIYETAKTMYSKKEPSEWLKLDRRYIEKLIKEGVGYTKATQMLLSAKKGK